MPPTQDRLFLGRTHHRDAPVSTAVGPITGTPRWDTWQGRVAPSLPLFSPPPCPTYHRASASVPVPRGEGLPRMVGTSRFWAGVPVAGGADLSPRLPTSSVGRVEALPKGSTFSLHPARKSVRSPRWSAFFRSSEHWVCHDSSSLLLSCCGGAPSFLVLPC